LIIKNLRGSLLFVEDRRWLMYFELLRNPSFYELLQRCDADLAEEEARRSCRHCGGVLHRGNYGRKPRVAPGVVLPEGYWARHSLCCGTEGCRKRATPPSVRFLGRRVFLGAVVVLCSAMLQGITPWRLSRLAEALGASKQTLRRWRQWWLEVFPATPLWRVLRSQLMPPVDAAALPRSLVVRMCPGMAPSELQQMLQQISPLSTCSSAGLGRGF
jgi:hypothetical protein